MELWLKYCLGKKKIQMSSHWKGTGEGECKLYLLYPATVPAPSAQSRPRAGEEGAGAVCRVAQLSLTPRADTAPWSRRGSGAVTQQQEGPQALRRRRRSSGEESRAEEQLFTSPVQADTPWEPKTLLCAVPRLLSPDLPGDKGALPADPSPCWTCTPPAHSSTSSVTVTAN